MGSYQWQWNIPELRQLSQFEEGWCRAGEENTWLKKLSDAAREALHRFVARDFDCPQPEMENLCSRLQKAAQLHYFDIVRRAGGDTTPGGR